MPPRYSPRPTGALLHVCAGAFLRIKGATDRLIDRAAGRTPRRPPSPPTRSARDWSRRWPAAVARDPRGRLSRVRNRLAGRHESADQTRSLRVGGADMISGQRSFGRHEVQHRRGSRSRPAHGRDQPAPYSGSPNHAFPAATTRSQARNQLEASSDGTLDRSDQRLGRRPLDKPGEACLRQRSAARRPGTCAGPCLCRRFAPRRPASQPTAPDRRRGPPDPR